MHYPNIKGTLFTQYFLTDAIEHTPEWSNISQEELKIKRNEIKELLEKFRYRPNPNEAETIEEVIIPILQKLNFFWIPQTALEQNRRFNVPDLVLFPSSEIKEEFAKSPQQSKPWNKAIAILEAKRWSRMLDRADRNDTADPGSPTGQILRYMSIMDIKSGGTVQWAILTNGQRWRLYYFRITARAEAYIEFDLEKILNDDSDKEFKLFYLFFRKDAFIPTHWRPKKNFLQFAIDEGKRWESKITENLKDIIFTDVFPQIATGFWKQVPKDDTSTEIILQKIYDNTLIFLYRLLFLFYAEDRDLLSIRIPEYKIYSLFRIRDEIAKKIDKGLKFSSIATSYWDRLKSLFHLIDSGDPTIDLATYNGGLFNAEKHPFLEKYSVPDAYLVPVIDKLSRDYSDEKPKWINYSDLSVRQLGSIYEGLLEFKLQIAQTHLGIKQQNGKEVYYPIDNEASAVIKQGQLFLTNDKSERKSTGSYYTPDYIVQYIIKNSVEPLISDKIKEFETWKKELDNKNKQELQKLLHSYGISFDPKKYDESGKVIGEKSTAHYRTELLKIKDPATAIFTLNILDPAMGSGHFLVGIVDYIADRVLEILEQTSNTTYFSNILYISPLYTEVEDIRKEILLHITKKEFAKLDDKDVVKRLVLKRSVYGVDINPLAVELAKVSLWLHTFTIGAPLSFLDHHIKCGNSLIGARIEDFTKTLAGNLFGSQYAGLMSAVDLAKQLQDIPDSDISQVKHSSLIYNSITEKLEPYRRILNIYTAQFFMENSQGKTVINLLKGAQGNPLDIVSGKVELSDKDKYLLNKALAIAKQKHFFHWEIEFPEIFFNGKKVNAKGFDVVVGNPPYLMELRNNKDIFRALHLSPTVGKYYEDKMDIFYFFIHLGVDLIKNGGYLGYIVQEYWISRSKAKKLRKKIFNETLPKEFVFFKEFKIFPDAPGQHNMILILKKETFNPQSKINIKLILWKKLYDAVKDLSAEDKDKFITEALTNQLSGFFESFEKKLSLIYSPNTDKVYILNGNITEKLEALKTNNCETNTFNLEKNEISQGLVANPPQAFIFQKGEKINFTTYEKNLLKPFGSAITIDKFFVNQFIGEKIAYLTKEIKEKELISKCPNFIRRLENYKEYLKNRREVLLGRIPWYSLHWPRSKDIFEDPHKIIGVRKTKHPKFVVVEEPYYMDQSVFIIRLIEHTKYSSYYVNALLNSKLAWWWFYQQKRQGEQLQIDKEVLLNFPIPSIDFSTKDERITEELKNKYLQGELIDIEKTIKNIANNSAILHDFVAFLAQKITQLNQSKYLLELFIAGEIKHGTQEMINVIELLEKHPHWQENASQDLKKELAYNIISEYNQLIESTDRLIDRIVYHLYGLSDQDILAVEKYFANNKKN